MEKNLYVKTKVIFRQTIYFYTIFTKHDLIERIISNVFQDKNATSFSGISKKLKDMMVMITTNIEMYY